MFRARLGVSDQQHSPVGGEGGQQASNLSSKHKLWNFHRFWLVLTNFLSRCPWAVVPEGSKGTSLLRICRA